MRNQNPLLKLRELGQSIWLDYLSRGLIRSGKLKDLISADGVSGMTSNPAIFEKSIGESSDYDADIRRLAEEGKTSSEIYEELAIEDIREAAGILLPNYIQTGGMDGYVSLEVSPLLAHDTEGTVREARHLWSAVSRSNVMIKIPAMREGLPAIEHCTAEGININVTLLFGLDRYREVADAYMRGLERRAQQGHSLRNVRSVASFFLSRIDVLVDQDLEQKERSGGEQAKRAHELRGRTAIASAKIAYQIYKELFTSERFRRLEQQGARKQWLLWGSTSTKTKEYSDVKYVEALIGPETVNTMPLETLEAYRDHGAPQMRLELDIAGERDVLTGLAALGIDINTVTRKLEEEGVNKFVQPFEKLMRVLAGKTQSVQRA